MVLHLRVIKVNNYNEYILKDINDNKEYNLVLEFYGISNPKINDIILISDKLLNPNNKWYSQPYAFELLNNKDKNVKQYDLLGIISQDKQYVLKRIFG